jgi:hypothetical protein
LHARTHVSNPHGPFDESAEQLLGECCIDFLDGMFHGVGKLWDIPIASSDEIKKQTDAEGSAFPGFGEHEEAPRMRPAGA